MSNLPDYILKVEQHRAWEESQSRTIDSFAYKLKFFRHTKPNPNRKVHSARKGFVWIGSWPNFESRLKHRWPIRFFFAYTVRRDIWWPIKRLPKTIRESLTPYHDPMTIKLHAVVAAVFGREPEDNIELEMMLMKKSEATIHLYDRVIKAYGSARYLDALSQRIRQLDRNVKLRPGYPGMSFEKYPEMQWITQLRGIQSDIRKDITKAIAQLMHLKDNNAPVHPTKEQ